MWGAMGGDLLVLVVDHEVGHLHRFPAGRHSKELAGVGADEIGFQRRLGVVQDQGLELGSGVEGLGASR
jgi:hypothetical protein